MLDLILTLVVLWVLFKLGIGLLKVLGVFVILGLVFFFASFLFLPLLGLIAVGSLGALIFNH